jgi:hypothetical protein
MFVHQITPVFLAYISFMFLLQSFHYCKYRRDENQLYIFADDSVPRWVTAAQHIDFDTMAGADKFGNIYFVVFLKISQMRLKKTQLEARLNGSKGS